MPNVAGVQFYRAKSLRSDEWCFDRADKHRRVLHLHNNTPFAATLFAFPDREGFDTLVVTVQATLEWAPRLAVAEVQRPVPVADDDWADPSSSSSRRADRR